MNIRSNLSFTFSLKVFFLPSFNKTILLPSLTSFDIQNFIFMCKKKRSLQSDMRSRKYSCFVHRTTGLSRMNVIKVYVIC